MAGATTGSDALFSMPMRKNASMMPQTVPNRPMKGEADAMLDNVGISELARCCSAAMARFATASRSSLDAPCAGRRRPSSATTRAPGESG
jgi:hypothetical protein